MKEASCCYSFIPTPPAKEFLNFVKSRVLKCRYHRHNLSLVYLNHRNIGHSSRRTHQFVTEINYGLITVNWDDLPVSFSPPLSLLEIFRGRTRLKSE